MSEWDHLWSSGSFFVNTWNKGIMLQKSAYIEIRRKSRLIFGRRQKRMVQGASVLSMGEFLHQLAGNPPLQVTTLLVLGVIFVNGATDAPNAITSLVASGGMEMKKAVRMAAFFNFAGLALMTAWNANVAFTICHMVDFGGDAGKALAALCAALAAIILWASAAWCFGIPTSESHALIAGLTGAAISIHKGMAGIHWQEWIKVLYGLVFSGVCGLGMGYIGGKCLRKAEKRKGRRIGCSKKQYENGKRKGAGQGLLRNQDGIVWAQAAGAAAMAFMHGAQDGQKFMGVFLLGIFLARGNIPGGDFSVPLWMTALCSAVMAAGTAAGGGRIIKKVGMDMVRLRRPQGIVSDAAAAVCLLFSTWAGMPVSTTHVKTTSIIGAGLADDAGTVDMAVVREMVLAWVVTFPCCGWIGYMTAEWFQRLI